MNDPENDRFDSPRYRLTHVGRDYRSYIDLETGIGYCVDCDPPKGITKTGHDHYEKIAVMGRRDEVDTTENPVAFEDEIRLIVGITIGGTFPRWIGDHACVMYIDNPYNPAREANSLWRNDIMLDASGSFGINWEIRNPGSDVVVPERSPSQISIDGYRRYFYPLEGSIWHTYSYSIDKIFGTYIHELIGEMFERSSFSCASKTSDLLKRTGLFEGIGWTYRPVAIKGFLEHYVPVNKNVIRLVDKSSYDLGSRPPIQGSWA